MLVELKKLKNNPLRDFIVDPLDQEHVDRLAGSINESGFWGGIACRMNHEGNIEIAAGHHRVQAAILAGVEWADLTVANAGDMSTATLVRIYAMENATQRANTGTAQVGTVAATLRFIAKALLTETFQQNSGKVSLGSLKGQLTSNNGLGIDVVLRFLDGIPGINVATVRQALVNLKSSGNYARIIKEVQEEIDRENDARVLAIKDQQERDIAAAKAEIERKAAEKAMIAAAEHDNMFDFEGVSKVFKHAHHIDVFRESVTKELVRSLLPRDKQAALATALAKLAKDTKLREITGHFIRTNITAMVVQAKQEARQLTKEEKERILQSDLVERLRDLQRNFSGGCRTMIKAGAAIAALSDKWPKKLVVPKPTNEFISAVNDALDIINAISERMLTDEERQRRQPRERRTARPAKPRRSRAIAASTPDTGA